MFNGRQIILGIPPDCIPGGTLKQKIVAIYHLQFEDVSDIAKKNGGFVAEVPQNSMFLIPAGLIIITITIDESRGLRWSFVPPDWQFDTISSNMRMKQESFPKVHDDRWESLSNIVHVG